MVKTISRAGLSSLFALALLSAPAAFAEEGKTTTGVESNSGSSGDKSDKNMQENAASADKSKQQGASQK